MGGENAQHRFSPGLETQLIPAHAGKTVAVQSTAPPCAAHPRSRGENMMKLMGFATTDGSPPLTRGKLVIAAIAALVARLIPAHAGKTVCGTRWLSVCRVHPRSRGENSRIRPRKWTTLGSSPLTRGKRARWRLGLLFVRLIPAHAGKTSPGQGRPRWCAAHPRSRGENTSPS